MSIYLSGFILSGGLDAYAPTGGLSGISPLMAQPRLRVEWRAYTTEFLDTQEISQQNGVNVG